MSIPKIKISTEKELDDTKMEAYLDGLNDPNSFHNWFSSIRESGVFDTGEILYPASNCFIIPFTWFKWLTGDKYTESKIEEFNNYILDSFKLHNNKKYFIKTGNFSNKFNFENCLVDDINKIGESFLDIFYAAMCVGAKYNPLFVLREYIESESEYEIYNGMPLRYEFRYFYDFDKGEMLGVSKYWHEKEMIKTTGLSEDSTIDDVMAIRDKTGKSWIDESVEEYIIYDKFRAGYDKYYEENKKRIGELICKNLKKKTLNGKWSIDIMVEGDKLYLIDMALMENSALVNHMEDIDEISK